MLFPVRCTCGKQLASIYDAFRYVRSVRLQEALKKHGSVIQPAMLSMNDNLQPMLGDVLDSLCVTRSCCRVKLLTTSLFSEYY